MGAWPWPQAVPAGRAYRAAIAAALVLVAAVHPARGESVGRRQSRDGTLDFGDRRPAGRVPLRVVDLAGGDAGSPSHVRSAPRRAGGETSALDGMVLHVDDGDSFVVAMHGREVRVRIAEIDAPEAGQPYGERARAALAGLVEGRVVRIDEVDSDRYGRVVAHVAANGFDVGAELVRRGAARVYRSYATSAALDEIENEARSARRGLWALSEAEREPPWSWRRRHRDTSRAPGAEPAAGPVVGNARSRIYHRPDCPDYGSISPRSRVPFPSRAAAEAAGYRQAGNCP